MGARSIEADPYDGLGVVEFFGFSGLAVLLLVLLFVRHTRSRHVAWALTALFLLTLAAPLGATVRPARLPAGGTPLDP